jgi:hypothetical protein
VFIVLKEAIPFGKGAFLDQIEKLQLSKCFTNLFHLFIHKSQGQPSQINLVVLASLFQILLFQISLSEEIFWPDHFEGGCAFNIIDLGMFAKEVFDSP